MNKLLLKPTEAGELLGVSRSTIYMMMARKEIPGIVRIGRTTRISIDALRDWVNKQVAEGNRQFE